jgi:hypothetical protein
MAVTINKLVQSKNPLLFITGPRALDNINYYHKTMREFQVSITAKCIKTEGHKEIAYSHIFIWFCHLCMNSICSSPDTHLDVQMTVANKVTENSVIYKEWYHILTLTMQITCEVHARLLRLYPCSIVLVLAVVALGGLAGRPADMALLSCDLCAVLRPAQEVRSERPQ